MTKRVLQGAAALRRWFPGRTLAALLLATTLGGCSVSMGGRFALSLGRGSDATPVVVPPTAGEELSDLPKARNPGALSEEEYRRLKEVFLEE